MTILLILSVFINFSLVWMCINLYLKNTEMEKIIEDFDKLEEDTIKYHQVILGLISNAYAEFVRVDKRGSFSSDDEVGWSFKLMRDLIKDLTEKIRDLTGGEKKE
jgi:hypothetical protein